jgi:taurine transport system ATP-binding protein
MTELQLHNVSLTYETSRGFGRLTRTPVLDRVSLSIASGEFIAVLGRSGSGKTSLLNIAAGFLRPTVGRVAVDGREVIEPSAERAVVFQDDALFAWLNARDNIGFPLKLRGATEAARRVRAEELLALVGLKGLGDKAIWELSGGQRQRVGIARALAAKPDFLLMDEPLGALDAMTRERMQELLLSIWAQSGTGALLITHSVEEALFVGTRVIVLAPDPGRIAMTQNVDFGRRFLAGAGARALKADPGFIALRETLISAIHGDDVREAA